MSSSGFSAGRGFLIADNAHHLSAAAEATAMLETGWVGRDGGEGTYEQVRTSQRVLMPSRIASNSLQLMVWEREDDA